MRSSSNRYDEDACQKFFRYVGEICYLIQSQMNALDNVENEDSSRGFLFTIVENLKQLDEKSIKTELEKDETLLGEISRTLVLNREIEIRDGMVFPRRGGAKITQNLVSEKRRQSFASVSFANQEAVLRIESVKEMSDLDFLLNLNGYHLPYCESSNRRNMFEWFFSSFLREVHSRVPENPVFKLMEEAIPIICMTTELCVDLLECFFEAINIVRMRLKEVEMEYLSDSDRPPSPRAREKPFNDSLLEHLERTLRNPDKVFNQFRSRKLLNSIATEKDETWLIKLENYREAILEATFIHRTTCAEFRRSIQDLGSTRGGKAPLKPEVHAFCNDLIIYIDTYEQFVNLFDQKGFARKTLDLAREAIMQLDAEKLKISKERLSPRNADASKDNSWFKWSVFSFRKSPK